MCRLYARRRVSGNFYRGTPPSEKGDEPMTFLAECGLCGAQIKIPRSPDGRFLIWPCKCQTDRDVAMAKQTVETIKVLVDVLGKEGRGDGKRNETT